MKKNDMVRIICRGITAEGPVYSSYSDFGSDKPAGIEMYDENHMRSVDGEVKPTYRYWKSMDGGRVFVLLDGEWAQVYP